MSACYLSLGDSMSIDDYAGGDGRGAASLLLRNRDDEFPDWAGRDLSSALPGVHALLLARDGATSSDVVAQQLPAVRAARVLPTHITITCGGNDLLSCYGDTQTAAEVPTRVGGNLAHVLATLRELTGAAGRIVVSTVYDPSDGTGDLQDTYGLPPWPYAPALLAQLNDAIRSTAARYDALIGDVHGRFLGHGKRIADPAQPDSHPDESGLWYCGLVEPNAHGAHAIRTCWWQALLSARLTDDDSSALSGSSRG